jgi:hypothetical protein
MLDWDSLSLAAWEGESLASRGSIPSPRLHPVHGRREAGQLRVGVERADVRRHRVPAEAQPVERVRDDGRAEPGEPVDEPQIALGIHDGACSQTGRRPAGAPLTP